MQLISQKSSRMIKLLFSMETTPSKQSLVEEVAISANLRETAVSLLRTLDLSSRSLKDSVLISEDLWGLELELKESLEGVEPLCLRPLETRRLN